MTPRWLRLQRRANAPHIELLRIQPGDTIIAKVDRAIPAQAADEIRKRLEYKFPGHDALVLSDGVTLTAARHSGDPFQSMRVCRAQHGQIERPQL